MLMWVGHNINPQWVQDVFGVHSAAQIDIDKVNYYYFLSRFLRYVCLCSQCKLNNCKLQQHGADIYICASF